MTKVYISEFIFSISLLILCLSSCSESCLENGGVAISDKQQVEWNMILGTSRAVVGIDGHGYFEEGDTIVVYAKNMFNGNTKHYILCLKNGCWTPDIYWREIGEDVQFTAWYVASAYRLCQVSQPSYIYSHILSSNQQQNNGYKNSDLLSAQTRVQAGGKVMLRFGHALNRLHIVLESKDASYTDEQLQQAEVKIYTPSSLPFNLSDGRMQTPSDYQWIVPMRQSDSIWTALLCPQELKTLDNNEWIRIQLGENIVTLPVSNMVDGKPIEKLEAGKEVTYRLNLKKKDVVDEFSGTTRWVYGVRSADPGRWNADYTQLAWIDGCGWFDCNKINPSETASGGDGRMCWAAATSNLIHWWLQQNEETEAVKSYKGPQAKPIDMLHSEIFQLYKDHFPNQGDYPLKAINWFFNGVFHKRIYETDPVDMVAGFFRTQLGTHSLGMEYEGVNLSRDKFNAILKQALLSQQGILFVINLGRNWSTHAVTLWGMSFDEEGLVKTLYIVDNNDGRYDSRGTIRAMNVKYLPYSSSNAELYPYVPNSLGNYTIRIESLCTLSLGKEWIK